MVADRSDPYVVIWAEPVSIMNAAAHPECWEDGNSDPE